ncbi:dyslexia-associated protein KIAA0319 homolog isoform X1 [Marmota monax]|uniref:dyslexia-associated protein KIAA0319 homolog isoform X1 n=1 Tax=Marmota monax TaxID=9995 RepID=UPI0026EA02DC|nr:dyslexia-associated protein KIAA0319 homolog isoform X1 [Marmota monax]
MTPPAVSLASLLLVVTLAGGACQQCSQGRTYPNAVIPANLETVRIVPVPQTFSLGACTAACCDLPSCDLAWWFEGRCFLVSCPQEENCAPQKTGPLRSYLVFVLRPEGRPAPLLDYGERMLSRAAAAGAWGDPAEGTREDLPLGGQGQGRGMEGMAGMAEPSDDDGEMEPSLLQPSPKQGPSGSAEPAAWSLQPGGDGHSPAASSEKPRDPEPPSRKDSAGSASPEHSRDSGDPPPSAATPPPGRALGKGAASLRARGDAGREVLKPSQSPSASLGFRPAALEESSAPTATPQSAECSIPTVPSSAVPPGSTPGPPVSPTAAPRTVEELWVSAGDNLVVTLPQDRVELKASVVPAPPAETTYKYEWSLISHPADYQGDIEQGHRPTLHLSQLSAGLYTFKVAVSGEKASGEGFVNVTVKPAGRVNLPPVAVVSPQRQKLAPLTTAALIDGSGSTDDSEIVSYRWEAVSGPLAGQHLSDAPVLRVANLALGNHTVRLTVTDSDGATNSTTATLTVGSAVDHPPVANAGPNQTMTLPQNSITLNGNQSSDDHQIVLYEWSLDPSSWSKEVAMQAPQTPYLHLSALQEGEYAFRLLVTDSAGQQSTAVVSVVVQPGNNRPPVAVAGPDKELVFPVQSATLDGSRSSDDHGIVRYHWEHIGGPSAVEMENVDRAVATVTGLQVGTHLFRLTVADQQGLSSTSTLTLAVKKESNSPPRARAGGRHVLVLPNNSITLDGSRSTDDQGIVSYLWVRDGQSPAVGDVIDGSDHSVALQLTNLVEGVYTFHLRVSDSQGASDMDTATVEVQPDPRRGGLVELILQVGVGQLTEQRKDALVRQLAVLLDVLDSDIKVQRIQAHSDLSTMLVFYVQSGPPAQVLRAADVARALHRRLSREKADFLLFKVLRVDTAGCLLECSGHGRCDPITKRCVCSQLWMENLIQRYVRDGESNCEWSIFYVTGLACALLVLAGGVTWLCICCCHRQKRTKIRKKTKYTILDNMDEQERMELRPKYSIKHRSTEHNSSLMVSESEFDSEQDTVFSREGMERGHPQASRNGASFSYCSKDR